MGGPLRVKIFDLLYFWLCGGYLDSIVGGWGLVPGVGVVQTLWRSPGLYPALVADLSRIVAVLLWCVIGCYVVLVLVASVGLTHVL